MLERERRDLQRERHLQVVPGDERVDLAPRAEQLGLQPRVEVGGGAGCVEDPFGRKVAEQPRPLVQPLPVRAEAANEPVTTIGDLTAELDELRREVRLLRDVAGRPPVARVPVVVDERRTFAGQFRELSHLGELAQLLVDAMLAASQPCAWSVVHGFQYQAMRAVTMPAGVTATAVGTSATPYLRASSGRRDTSTVNTSRPAATSSRSSV